MSRIYAIDQVPELAGLGKRERRAILLYYLANKSPTRASRIREDVLVGSIIVAEIAGFVWGAVVWRNAFWGPVLGMTTTMVFVMLCSYFGNLRSEIVEFRRFLQTDHTAGLLRRQMGQPPANATAPMLGSRHAPLGASREYAAGSIDGLAQALKRVNFDMARSTEIMELSGELATQSLALFGSAKDKQQNAWQALIRLRLGRFVRLIRESNESQAEAFRLLRRSGDLLHGAEAAVGIAAALLREANKEFGNEG